jgi:hypothetical protein
MKCFEGGIPHRCLAEGTGAIQPQPAPLAVRKFVSVQVCQLMVFQFTCTALGSHRVRMSTYNPVTNIVLKCSPTTRLYHYVILYFASDRACTYFLTNGRKKQLFVLHKNTLKRKEFYLLWSQFGPFKQFTYVQRLQQHCWAAEWLWIRSETFKFSSDWYNNFYNKIETFL